MDFAAGCLAFRCGGGGGDGTYFRHRAAVSPRHAQLIGNQDAPPPLLGAVPPSLGGPDGQPAGFLALINPCHSSVSMNGGKDREISGTSDIAVLADIADLAVPPRRRRVALCAPHGKHSDVSFITQVAMALTFDPGGFEELEELEDHPAVPRRAGCALDGPRRPATIPRIDAISGRQRRSAFNQFSSHASRRCGAGRGGAWYGQRADEARCSWCQRSSSAAPRPGQGGAPRRPHHSKGSRGRYDAAGKASQSILYNYCPSSSFGTRPAKFEPRATRQGSGAGGSEESRGQ